MIISDRSSHGTARFYSVATLPSKATSNYEKRFSENLQYELFNDWLWKTGALSYNKGLLTDVNKHRCLTNDLSETKTKPRSGLLTTNNRWIETDGWPKTNLTWILQLRLYWPITFKLTDQTGNTIDWQALFTTSMDLLFTKNNSCVPMFEVSGQTWA